MVKFSSDEGFNQALALNGTVWGGTGSDGARFIKVERHDPMKQKKEFKKCQRHWGRGSQYSISRRTAT